MLEVVRPNDWGWKTFTPSRVTLHVVHLVFLQKKSGALSLSTRRTKPIQELLSQQLEWLLSPSLSLHKPTKTTTTMTNSSSAGYFRRLTVFEPFSRLVSIFVDSAHARLFIKLACLMVVPCTFVGMIIVKYVSTNLFQTHDTHSGSAYFLENWAAICKFLFSES